MKKISFPFISKSKLVSAERKVEFAKQIIDAKKEELTSRNKTIQQLSADYDKLSEAYFDLKDKYERLSKKYEAISDEPEIEVGFELVANGRPNRDRYIVTHIYDGDSSVDLLKPSGVAINAALDDPRYDFAWTGNVYEEVKELLNKLENSEDSGRQDD